MAEPDLRSVAFPTLSDAQLTEGIDILEGSLDG